MTIPKTIKQKQARRLLELCQTSRQRYLEAGGNPQLSVGSLNSNDNFTDAEKQEFLEVAEIIFDAEYINQYLQKRQGDRGSNSR